MNNFSNPNSPYPGPEVSMLSEMHSLWGRVFGRREAGEAGEPQRGRPVALVVLTGVVAVAVVVVRLLVN